MSTSRFGEMVALTICLPVHSPIVGLRGLVSSNLARFTFVLVTQELRTGSRRTFFVRTSGPGIVATGYFWLERLKDTRPTPHSHPKCLQVNLTCRFHPFVGRSLRCRPYSGTNVDEIRVCRGRPNSLPSGARERRPRLETSR